MRTVLAALLVAAVATPAFASTMWQITNADRATAARIATEQAMQRASADHSCYVPAAEKLCRRRGNLWSCVAEMPEKPSSCGSKGKWKTAIMAH